MDGPYRKANATKRVREVAASDVKNGWHTYLDRVVQGREEVIVTRYGKPIARLVPVEEEGSEMTGIFGWLAGTVTVLGDLTAPTGEVWEADA
jgi:prevent-host-death family protein